MVFERDNSAESDLRSIVYAIYIYSLMNVKKNLWLSGQEELMYAEMLDSFASGKNTEKHGWVSSLNLEGLKNKALKYIYLDRIKKKGWVNKKEDGYEFPPKLVSIVKALKEGEEVRFTIKA